MTYPVLHKSYSRNYKVYGAENASKYRRLRDQKFPIEDYRHLALEMADHFGISVPGVLYMPDSERRESARFVIGGYYEDDAIYLDPKWGTVKTFLHEFSHHLTDKVYGETSPEHGWQFVECRDWVFREAMKTCLFSRTKR